MPKYWLAWKRRHARLALGFALAATLVAAAACSDDAGSPDATCPAGSYDDGGSSTSCVPWATCAPGQYVASDGSPTADRTCAACARGSFSSADNAPSCMPWTTCAAGTDETSPPSDITDRFCAPCAAGTYCAGNQPAAACDPGRWDHDGDPATPCTPQRDCAPGQYVTAAGSATADRSCAGCTSGSFSAAENAPSCVPWTTCAAGTHVTNTPADTVDRTCAPCAPGTYTSGDNQASCLPQDSCPAGTVQTDPGTGPGVCAPCATGSFCAGGDQPAVACAAGYWDHDADPATTCAPRTDCAPGQYVSSDGSATADRSCATCATTSFSTTANAAACTEWTECGAGEVEAAPGTATSDRTCRPTTWTQQFGTSSSDYTGSVSVDGSGNIVVAGTTHGALPGQTSAGDSDAFVRAYSPLGDLRWTRQFGTSTYDAAAGVSVDVDGNVVVAGYTGGALPGQPTAGGLDAFVRRYDAVGNLLWTRQFGSSANDSAAAVTVDDASGNIVVVGSTRRTLPDQTSAGDYDVFLRVYDAQGNLLWTRQFGTNANDRAESVSLDRSGNIVVAGDTDGALAGAANAGDRDAFVRVYDAQGNLLWTRQFGGSDRDLVGSVTVDATDHIVIAGYTFDALPGFVSAGGTDAFVCTYDAAGNLLWTRQFGTTGNDTLDAVSADASGNIVVAGATARALPGQTFAGHVDAFVRTYDALGNVVSTRQFGTGTEDRASSVCFDDQGAVVVAGHTIGALPGQTSAGEWDGFVRRMDPQ